MRPSVIDAISPGGEEIVMALVVMSATWHFPPLPIVQANREFNPIVCVKWR